jgi:transcriptional regulator with XRE-family HTH domain
MVSSYLYPQYWKMEMMSSLRERFGERLRDLRFERRMTQEEFYGDLLKLSPTFGGVIERGIRAPSFENLDLIASNLGITVSELFDFSVEPGTRKRVKLPRKRTRKAVAKRKA